MSGAESLWERSFELAVGRSLEIVIGPMILQITRTRFEWLVRRLVGGDPLVETVQIGQPTEADYDPADAVFERYVGGDGSGRFRLRPALGDRSFVVRPVNAFRLADGAMIDVFVSTPVWIRMELAGAGAVLFDVPTLRPSDTWFGVNSREGELCYVSRTAARLELEAIPVRPARAVTRIRMSNRSGKSVTLERVLIPAPRLSLFIDPAGALWSNPVEITLAEREGADVFVASVPTATSSDARLLTPPRHTLEQPLLRRALSALWN